MKKLLLVVLLGVLVSGCSAHMSLSGPDMKSKHGTEVKKIEY